MRGEQLSVSSEARPPAREQVGSDLAVDREGTRPSVQPEVSSTYFTQPTWRSTAAAPATTSKARVAEPCTTEQAFDVEAGKSRRASPPNAVRPRCLSNPPTTRCMPFWRRSRSPTPSIFVAHPACRAARSRKGVTHSDERTESGPPAIAPVIAPGEEAAPSRSPTGPRARPPDWRLVPGRSLPPPARPAMPVGVHPSPANALTRSWP